MNGVVCNTIGTYYDKSKNINIKYPFKIEYFTENEFIKQRQKKLYEGLIRTIDPDKAIKILKKIVRHEKVFIIKEKFINTETFTLRVSFKADFFYDGENKEILSLFFDTAMNLGYEISDISKNEDISYIDIYLDPLFIEEMTNKVYNEYNGILYHISDKRKYNKFIHTGIIPKNNEFIKSKIFDDTYINTFFKYSDRTYFYLIPDYISDKAKKKYLIDKAKDLNRKHNYKELVVMKVDLKKTGIYNKKLLSTQYRFFEDPRAQNAVFTRETINPNYVELYFDISNKDISNE